MHIVIGVITAIAGLLWALNSLQRSGFDLGRLNPFAWLRRREWQQRYGGNPLYALTDPRDVAAVLLFGVARCDGELSSTQKKEILRLFVAELKLTDDEAADQLRAASHLMRNEVYLVDNVERVLAPALGRFSDAQMASLLNMMEQVARIDGEANAEQRRLVDAVVACWNRRATGSGRAW